MVADLGLIAALLGGFIILAISGDFLVRSAVSLAQKLGVSPLIAGVFIVGFGSSAPEMLVSVSAAAKGSPALALGNIVGSNIANVWLVLAVPALIYPLMTNSYGVRRSLVMVIFATGLWIGLSAFYPFATLTGVSFLSLLVLYMIGTVWQTQSAVSRGIDVGVGDDADLVSGFTLWACVLVGLVGLPLGAYLIVEGGVGLARAFDVSEELIGLTLLAVGTSLPELGAGLAAAIRRRGDVVIGNVLGSVIFNLLAAGGLVALLGPVSVPESFLRFDHWAMAAAVLTLALFIFPRSRISRLAALVMLLIYAVYLYGLIYGWNFLSLVPSLA
ncbi:MAG: calcium/sodium antiporter [Pseudomonadota bacterium]